MSGKIREWTLHEEIGRGGMGVVYRATHDILKGEWAVKVMLPQLADDVDYRRRFLSEATVLAGLRHANIISIQTPFQEDGQLYLPMELLTGQSLAQMLKAEKGPWQSLRVMDIIRQVAEGLAYVHGRVPPVLHRDIKPENIQIMDDGLVKIFDFGLARPMNDEAATLTGKAIGTPDFMAPELLTGSRPSTGTDVFALGIVIYRLLAGRFPWDLPRELAPLSRVAALFEAHRSGLPDVRKFAPHADPRLADLCMRSISADPAARPSDGNALLALLGGRASSHVLETDDGSLPGDDDVDSDSLSWGIGSRVGDSLDVDYDSPLIPKDFDDGRHRPKVIRSTGYRGRRTGLGAGVAIMVVGLVLCAGGFAAWWLARDWEGMKPMMDRVGAVVSALTGDMGVKLPGKTVDVDAVDAKVQRHPAKRGHARATGSAWPEQKAAGGAAGPVGGVPDVTDNVREPDAAVEPYVSPGERHAALAGISWVRVDGGRFTMGLGGDFVQASPAHDVSVASFELSREEVTVAQYRLCVDEGVCTAPYWTDCRGYTREARGRTGKIRNFNETRLGFVEATFRKDDHPVVCVDWDQADVFARWVGGRLPTEAEWEFAARAEGGLYPWGDARPSCRLAVMGMMGGRGPDGDTWGCGRETTWPVCSKKGGNTASGLCDMAGNAMEWVQDAWMDGYAEAPSDGSALTFDESPKHVCRGGSWYSYPLGVRATFRVGHDTGTHDIGIGFRVARTPLDGGRD